MEENSDCESDRSIASLANSDVIDLDQDEDFARPPRLRPEQIETLKSKFQINQSPDWEQVISAPYKRNPDTSGIASRLATAKIANCGAKFKSVCNL